MPARTLFVLMITTLLSLQLHAQDKLTNALNKQLIPLSTLDPDSGFTDLQALKPFLAGKMLFGIGEATHGTHEFSLFKHRMLEFLVKEMGVKAFILEDDFAGTQIMNDHILGGKTSITDAAKKGLGFGVWKTQEMVNMCTWLRSYNATQTAENKVRFFGCDMQWASSSLKVLKEYLQPQGKFTPEMELALCRSKKPLTVLQDSDQTVMRTAADQLSNIEFATDDTALYHHYVREVQQYAKYLESNSKAFPARQYDWRDQCMAENIEWIYNYTGHQKIMIWAHNAHIGKSGGSMRVTTMGEHLANYFRDKYYAMGFDFFKGSMRSFNIAQMKYETPQLPGSGKGTSGAIFSQCRAPEFIIDIRSASNAEPDADAFFNKKIASVSLGPSYFPNVSLNYVAHKLADTYDAIIFIRETTPVHGMN